MSDRKFALGIVANPYPTIGLVYLDEHGSPRKEKRFGGPYKFDARGNAISTAKNAHFVATIYNPHQPAGVNEVPHVTILDATPRSWDEAIKIALACPPGNHLEYRSEHDLRSLIAMAIQTVLA